MSRPMRGAGRDLPIVQLGLSHEADVVLARQRARLISELLGFGAVDQTRIATAISEIARNAIMHRGGCGSWWRTAAPDWRPARSATPNDAHPAAAWASNSPAA
jgi:hypothetical protein